MDLPHLQSLIKRTPQCYRDDFEAQFKHAQSALSLLRANPQADLNLSIDLHALLIFCSSCVHFYSPTSSSPTTDNNSGSMEETLATDLIGMLSDLGWVEGCPAPLRKTLVQCLQTMRSLCKIQSSVLKGDRLLRLYFELFRVKRDKSLRGFLVRAIVADITAANRPRANPSLNRNLQNFLFSVLTNASASSSTITATNPTSSKQTVGVVAADDANAVMATQSLLVMIELFQRGPWRNDARCVNIVALAAQQRTSNPKMQLLALEFFLGRKLSHEDDDDGADPSDEMSRDKKSAKRIEEKRRALQFSLKVAGGKKSRKRALQRLARKTQNGGEEGGEQNESGDESKAAKSSTCTSEEIIRLLNDPQGFADRLYSTIRSAGTNAPFGTKLLVCKVLARVIGLHALLLPDFYAFLQRFLHPNQRRVVEVLACAVQACHADLPVKELLAPLVRAITASFVQEHNQPPQIQVGINAIRQICLRLDPGQLADLLLHSSDGGDTTDRAAELIEDIGQFSDPKRASHDKALMASTRAFLKVLRERAPGILPRKLLGRVGSLALLHKNREMDDLGGPVLGEEGAFETEVEETEELGDFDSLGEASESQAEDFESQSELSQSGLSQGRGVGIQTQEALPLAATRMLTQDEFKQVRMRNLDAFSSSATLTKESSEAIIDAEGLTGDAAKTRSTRESRRATVEAGRPDRSEFGTRRRGKERASLPNAAKAKASKPQAMLAHAPSVHRKRLRSSTERLKVAVAHRNRQKLRR